LRRVCAGKSGEDEDARDEEEGGRTQTLIRLVENREGVRSG
jgi:hypothetical protein